MSAKPKAVYDSGDIKLALSPRVASPGIGPKKTKKSFEEFVGDEPTPQARGPMPVIVGCPRSGTTLLAVMLDSHPQIAIPPETAFLPHLGKLNGKEGAALRRSFFDLLTTDCWGVSNWNDIGIAENAYWRRLCALRIFSITGGLRLLFGMYADDLGKRLFGEKTPADTHCIPEIEGYLPEARFIHIIRDPRDVVLSLRSTSVRRSVEESTKIWLEMVSIARASRERVGHYHELRYEDLVFDPEGELRKICDFLEIPYSSRMLEYRDSAARHLRHLGDRPLADTGAIVPHTLRRQLHENLARPPRRDRVHGWRGAMSVNDRTTVELVAARLMGELGYDNREDMSAAVSPRDADAQS